MFDPTKDIQSVDKKNSVLNEATQLRQKTNVPSPSQSGRFLQALHKRCDEKLDRKGNLRPTIKTDDENSREKKGLLNLARQKRRNENLPKEFSRTESADDHETDSSDFGENNAQTTLVASTQLSPSSSLLPNMIKSPDIESTELVQNAPLKRAETSIFTLLSHASEELPHKRALAQEMNLKFDSKDENRNPLSLLELSKTNMQKTVIHVAADETIDNPSVHFQKQQNLIKIIDALTDQIVSARTKELSTTEITLKYPPIFEGAKITIQEFSSAQNEFNISFSSLSPDAKRLIESQSNQGLLQSKLLEQGYTLRMVTIDQGIRFNETNFTSLETGGNNSHRGSDQDSSSGSKKEKREDSFI